MTSARLEAFLARLYVDGEARARFLADPRAEARCAGLPEDTCLALAAIDRVGLEMAAVSFERKRLAQARRQPALRRLRRWWGRIRPRFVGGR
jgi:hypothetical protein